MTAISLEDVRKSFGKYQALKGVSLNVQEGSVTGFVGPNGAGKTTTIKVVAGLVRPDSGEVRLLGRDPFEDVEVMNEVSFAFTRLMYPPTNTVLEYLEDHASLFGGDAKKRSRSSTSRITSRGGFPSCPPGWPKGFSSPRRCSSPLS